MFNKRWMNGPIERKGNLPAVFELKQNVQLQTARNARPETRFASLANFIGKCRVTESESFFTVKTIE